MIRNCQQCGKEFNIKLSAVKRGRGKYCSRKCSDMARRSGEYNTCLICGTEYYVIAQRLSKGDGKYCSISCAQKAVWVEGAHDNLRNGEHRTCVMCGGQFYIRQSHIDQGAGRCCSKSCAQRYCWEMGLYDHVPNQLRTGEWINCNECGKEFYAPKSQIENGRGWCSYRCSNKSRWASGVYDGVFRSPTSIELSTAKALDVSGIAYQQEWRPDDYTRIFDFYVMPNVLIEIQGDYWHTLPGVPERDAEKAAWAKENGFDMVELWEHEIHEQGAAALIKERVIPLMEAV